MSSEHRLIRPYPNVAPLQVDLDNCYLSVGADVRSDNDETLFLKPLDFLSQAVVLVFASEGTALQRLEEDLGAHIAAAGIDPADLELLVVASTQRLKLSEIVWRLGLDQLDELPAHVELAVGPNRPSALKTPSGGCRIDVFLALRRELSPHALRPWRKGTWLAHVRFTISTDLGEIGFTPLPLDDAKRDELGIPRTTNRIVVIEGSVLDSEFSEDDLQLYVDVDLLGQLDQFSNSSGSRAFQRQLFLDAAAAIMVNAASIDGFMTMPMEDIEGSLVHKLVALVAGRRKGDSAEQLTARQAEFLQIAQTDPSRFMAHIEARVAKRSDLAESFVPSEAS